MVHRVVGRTHDFGEFVSSLNLGPTVAFHSRIRPINFPGLVSSSAVSWASSRPLCASDFFVACLKRGHSPGHSTMESVDFRRNPRPSCERRTHTHERPACSGSGGQVYTKSNTFNITKPLLPVVESSGRSTDNAMRAWLLAFDWAPRYHP